MVDRIEIGENLEIHIQFKHLRSSSSGRQPEWSGGMRSELLFFFNCNNSSA